MMTTTIRSLELSGHWHSAAHFARPWSLLVFLEFAFRIWFFVRLHNFIGIWHFCRAFNLTSLWVLSAKLIR